MISGLAEEDAIVESFKNFANFSSKQEKSSDAEKSKAMLVPRLISLKGFQQLFEEVSKHSTV